MPAPAALCSFVVAALAGVSALFVATLRHSICQLEAGMNAPSHQLREGVVTGFVGSLYFTYGSSGYSSCLAAKLFMSRFGLFCQTIESSTSRFNEQYSCSVLSVDFEPGSGNTQLALAFVAKGDSSLGEVQQPDTSILELCASRRIVFPLVRVMTEVQSANLACGTLFYQVPLASLRDVVVPCDTALLTKHHARKATARKRCLRLDGARSADAFSVIGTGGLALSERLIGASEGLRGRIMFSGNAAAAPQPLSKLRDDRLLEVLLEQSNLEGVRVGESTNIFDLECVQCCREVGLCVCETKPCAIGAGAQGTVWKYRRSSDKSFVAIKKVSSCSRFDSSWRLDGEAAVMTQLAKNGSHHVIPFYGSFVDCDGFINLCMKCLDKGSLTNLLSTHHRLVLPAVSVLALHLLSALRYFHNDLNLLHRDIKPSNIMIEDDGRFVLADLALAILTSAGPASANLLTMAGTMQYMSPECLNDGVASPASDMWSFGIVLLQALLGYCPSDACAEPATTTSSATPHADAAAVATDSTSEYWRLRSHLAAVKSPIYMPGVRLELGALGRAFDVQVLDFFDRCLHPVRPGAGRVHLHHPVQPTFPCILFSRVCRRMQACARVPMTCSRMISS